jgi:hypothetical protein
LSFVSGTESTAVLLIAILAIVYFGIYQAERGKNINIRELAAIVAIEEGVGRSAEMGRPVFFAPGSYARLDTANSAGTLAGVAVASYTAGICAKYDTPFQATTQDPPVMRVLEESIGAAYANAGRSELPVDVQWQTGHWYEQVGRILRYNPGAVVLVGAFSGDSYFMAEAGASIGAMVIGGTTRYSLVPDMVVMTDYMLIADECFAALAQITKDPLHTGSLWGTDWFKWLWAALSIVGAILFTAGISLPI